MDLRYVAVLFALALVAGGYFLFFKHSSMPSLSTSLSVSPNPATPGDYVQWTATVSSLTPGEYACISSDSYYSSRYCMPNAGGSGYCPDPCQPFPSLQSSADSDGYQAWVCAANSSGDGCFYDSTNDAFRVLASSNNWGAVDFVNVTSSGSGEDGVLLPPGTSITFTVEVEPRGVNPPNDVAVAVCVEDSMDGFGVSSIGGLSEWKYESGSWWGRDWVCEVWYKSGLSGATTVGLKVTNGTSNFRHVYFSVAPRCWWDSSYCTFSDDGSLFVYAFAGNVHFYSDRIFARYRFYGDLSNCPSAEDYDDVYAGWDRQTGCVVPTDASPGTYEGHVELYDFTPIYLYDRDGTIYVVYSTENLVGSATATLTVQTPASSVALYDYGSDSGYPEQEPDDHYVEFRVKVTGGTVFDSVKIYIDGSLKATYEQSDMTCGSDYCYKDSRISLSGYSDGSHTIKAELYVDGSLKDSDQRTFNYYQVGVRNVSASQQSNTQFQVSWEMKGGWKQYRVYIDDSSCVAQDWTGSGPSDAHDWQSFGPYTYDIPSCAATSGTHTVYVEARDESGTTASDSATVNFSFVYSYSVTVTSPADGSVVHQQTDTKGSPGDSISTSASYSTDSPSATLKLIVNSNEVSSWTVTGSGSQSYTVPPSYLQCGSDTFKWAFYEGDSEKASDSSTVTLYCWYVSVSPSGTVDVPSDGTNVLGSVDVYIDADVTPSADYNVQLFWNSTDISGLVTSEGCGSYPYCAHVSPDDVSMSCGDNVTLTAKLVQGDQVRATGTSNITLNCVEQYVIIREPPDGSAYDVQGQTVPEDFELNVGVDYDGGTTLRFFVNGSEVSVDPVSPCDYDACYSVSGSYLSVGDNNVEVQLYNESNTLVASDRVSVTIYAWAMQFQSTYGTDTGVLSVKEYASHASSCSITFDSNTYPMLYSDATRTWDYTVYRSQHDGKSFTVSCRSPTGAEIFSYSGTVSFSAGGGGGGGGGGGYTPPPPPKQPEVLPFWPDKATAGQYSWTIIDRKPFDAGVFTGAAVSSAYVCISSGDVVVARYCGGDVSGIPRSADALNAVLERLQSSGCVSVGVSNVGDFQCVPFRGTGLYVFSTGGVSTRILVAGGAPGVGLVAVGAVLLVAALIVLYVLGYLHI